MAATKFSFERIEKKYFLTPEQQDAMIRAFRGHMVSDAYGRYSLCNIYYDTPDWRLIRASIEKPVYKEKLRVRSYGVPAGNGKVFVELKKKYEGVVYKRRIVLPACDAPAFLRGEAVPVNDSQVGSEIQWFQRFYHAEPRVYIGYDRIAFAGVEDPNLRITFDTNLRWRDTQLDLRAGNHGSLLLPWQQVLMEVKIPGACPLWLARLLTELRLYPVSFSKYGTCYRDHIVNFDKEARFSA